MIAVARGATQTTSPSFRSFLRRSASISFRSCGAPLTASTLGQPEDALRPNRVRGQKRGGAEKQGQVAGTV